MDSLIQRPRRGKRSQTPVAFWMLRASDLLCALIFSTVLPWQQTFTWFAVVAGIRSLRLWHISRPQFQVLPTIQRRRIYRYYLWLLMGFIGSSCYFLYVPDNVAMQAVLGIYLLGCAALLAVPLTGDYVRTQVAVCLAVLPTSIRFLVEGSQGSMILTLLGAGGVLVTLSIVSMCRIQERILIARQEQQQRAERAANAVADVGLAKSRFFAAVSHDLRQPVHAIGLYLEPLVTLSRNTGDRAAQHAVEGIRQSWRALDDLLSQVLDLTRMDSGVVEADIKPIEIAGLVRSLILQHSAAAEHAGIRIVALVKAESFVMADDLMLRRVLSNLLDNAIKFAPAGSTVVVAMRHGQDVWRLQIRDAGRGIARDAQDKIFEEFVQLQNHGRDRQSGLGLGLAISRRFVLLMRGSISVRSAPGQGCCMTVTLPKTALPIRNDEMNTQEKPMESPDLHIEAQGSQVSLSHAPAFAFKSILLVEDDHLVAGAMRQLLQSWGLQVHHVRTAEEALRNAEFGQIAICDVRLPEGVSGLDVALQMRNRGKKVMLLSGETTADLRENALRNDLLLLTKPVSSAHLLKSLERL